MIKKLRIRFVAVAMLCSFLILLAIIGSVNVINYKKVTEQADSTLSLLAQYGGDFINEKKLGPGENDGVGYEGKTDENIFDSPWFKELPYESRYFSVTIKDEQVVKVDVSQVAVIDEKEARELADSVIDSSNKSGFRYRYRYLVNETENGTQILFLDCMRSIVTYFTFLSASAGISFAGLLVVLLILIFASGLIVRPVAQSIEKQKQFVTDAGHELKTPVTVIEADAEVLKMEIGDSEWIDDIQLQTKRLATLTNNLVYLSRLEEADRKIKPSEFSMSESVNETAKSFQALAKLQEKSFSMKVEQGITMKGDKDSFGQLVCILLDNAVKYSNEKGEIKIDLSKGIRSAVLTVRNSTDSPLPENLEDLFDRFYTADKSRSTKAGGYGLGLSIAKAIVEAHKGKIKIEKNGNVLSVKATFPH